MNTKSLILATLALLGVGVIGPIGTRAEVRASEVAFKKHCVNCHSLTPGMSSIAPDLSGVVGRKAGSLENYKYSVALKDSDFAWTPEKLDHWLQSPHGVTPETEMTFVGLKSEKDRAEVIDFLKHYAPKK